MSITAETRLAVRERAAFACEYCGVTETDSGAELTVDHYYPQSLGGNDDQDNLLYSCSRCNQYKSDYWPESEDESPLWNPRHDARNIHFLLLADGRLHPLTPIGQFTIQRLRLNRSPLVAHRLQKIRQEEERRLLEQHQEALSVSLQLHRQRQRLLAEQQNLLEEQRSLIQLLLDRMAES